jgi:hypothetical protein
MKRSFAILLAVLFSLFLVFGCATTPAKKEMSQPSTYTFIFSDQPNFTFYIPIDIPDITKLSGTIMTVFESEKKQTPFKLVAFLGKTSDGSCKVVVLHALEGKIGSGEPGKDWGCYIIAIGYEGKGTTKIYIDKSYYEKGIATGRFTKVNPTEWPDLEKIVKMKTGKVMHKIYFWTKP